MQMSGKLDGKVCIVTGAASGLGQSVAKAFTKEGGAVCLFSYGFEGGKDTVKQIVDMGYPEPLNKVVDQTNRDEVKSYVSEIIEKHGRIDVVANIASTTEYLRILTKCRPEIWDFMLNGALTIHYNLAYEVIPHMQKQHYGVFVHCSSIGGVTGYGGGAAYSVAKHGLIGLSRVIACEYCQDGIRSNVVCPGGMDGPLAGDEFKAHKDEITGESTTVEYFQRCAGWMNTNLRERGVPGIASPDEIAPVFVFFASDDSRWITGDSVVTANGIVMP
jgi:NAD(P)-dependent dehydrogenase (short-subunit alcohol dehydrogenase family)